MKTSYDEIRRMAFRALDAGNAAAGIDEDSAYAVAWLEATGLPGLTMLADAIDGSTPECRALGLATTDSGTDTVRITAEERSCAFFAAAIVDLLVAKAETAQSGASDVELTDAKHPLFLLPMAARFCPPDARIELTWRQHGKEMSFIVTRTRVLRSDADCKDSEWSDGTTIETVGLTCALGGSAGEAEQPCVLGERLANALHDGLDVDDHAYARVTDHAAKILVPETQVSRVSGAGAGLTDND